MPIVLAEKPPVARSRAPVAARAKLVVRREDIAFRDVAPGRVAISIRVTNEGDATSEPTTAAIEAAPLGVFVPWRPLTVMEVPSVEPGKSIEVQTEVARPSPRPLGPPDRVPARAVRIAAGQDDRAPEASKRRGAAVLGALLGGMMPSGGLAKMFALMQGDLRGFRAAVETDDPALPFDLFDLLGQSHPHWAGNLNVFIGARPVERHLAQALRIYAGRTNLAMFMVGDSERDAYRFELSGLEHGWHAALFHPLDEQPLALAVRDGRAIKSGEWIELRGTALMVMALRPPEACLRGEVHVHVTQRSSGKTGLVEFSLDPSAAEAGCFVVA